MKDFLLLKEKRNIFGLDQVRNEVGQNEDRREYKKSLLLCGGRDFSVIHLAASKLASQRFMIDLRDLR